MIQSMTGYGKAVAQLPNKKITVEIKSLNSKQCDLFTRLPFIYREKEIELRNSLVKLFERGKIDFNFIVEVVSKDVSSKIDHNVVKQYQQEIRKMADEMGINEPNEWFATLLRLPDVMKQEVEELDENEWAIIEKAINEAAHALVEFRKQEGKMLHQILVDKTTNIEQLLNQIEPLEAERLEKIKTRLLDELTKLSMEYDKSRFEQELIYYIEKLDVNEEKNRLRNHLKYFNETLNSKGSQGKKLGFIAQEIGREINTLGSKSNHAEMQRIIVQMKDELEQMKEQILNVL